MNNKSIGLWNKQSQKGITYASGKTKIDGKEYRITLFTNNNKKTEKSPDYSVIIEESSKSSNETKTSQYEPKNSELEQNKTNQEELFKDFGNSIEIDDMDIGF